MLIRTVVSISLAVSVPPVVISPLVAVMLPFVVAKLPFVLPKLVTTVKLVTSAVAKELVPAPLAVTVPKVAPCVVTAPAVNTASKSTFNKTCASVTNCVLVLSKVITPVLLL